LNMVGPKDGGFGFDQSKKYTEVENLDEVCVQCLQSVLLYHDNSQYPCCGTSCKNKEFNSFMDYSIN